MLLTFTAGAEVKAFAELRLVVDIVLHFSGYFDQFLLFSKLSSNDNVFSQDFAATIQAFFVKLQLTFPENSRSIIFWTISTKMVKSTDPKTAEFNFSD